MKRQFTCYALARAIIYACIDVIGFCSKTCDRRALTDKALFPVLMATFTIFTPSSAKFIFQSSQNKILAHYICTIFGFDIKTINRHMKASVMIVSIKSIIKPHWCKFSLTRTNFIFNFDSSDTLKIQYIKTIFSSHATRQPIK